jgi:hypothetical protein
MAASNKVLAERVDELTNKLSEIRDLIDEAIGSESEEELEEEDIEEDE